MKQLLAIVLAGFIIGLASSQKPISMEIFDAMTSNDMADLNRWKGSMTEVLRETRDDVLDSMLRYESCSANLTIYANSTPLSMCDAFYVAGNRSTPCPSPLLPSECKAIYMYSISNFSSSYSRNTRKKLWDLYKVFNALLFGAISKLSEIRPMTKGTILYRGLTGMWLINSTGRFYFNQFTSTSYDPKVAAAYSNDTLLEIKVGNPNLMANLTGLTHMEESEVLVAPFVALDYVNSTGNVIHLKTSSMQDFYNATSNYTVQDFYNVTTKGISVQDFNNVTTKGISVQSSYSATTKIKDNVTVKSNTGSRLDTLCLWAFVFLSVFSSFISHTLVR